MTRLNTFKACSPVASFTAIVTLYVPAVDGVPEIVAVATPRPRPVGSNPDAIDQVYGAVPPMADSIAL
jgi:hypothetical protein